MNSPLLNLLEGVQARASAQKTPVIDAIRFVVNSPATAAIVAATPTLFDDLVLAFARRALPPSTGQ